MNESDGQVLQEPVDRAQIQDVRYTYAGSVDTNDFERMSQWFTDDAMWDYGPEAGPVVTGSTAPDGWRICARKMLLAGKENYPAIGCPVSGR